MSSAIIQLFILGIALLTLVLVCTRMIFKMLTNQHKSQTARKGKGADYKD
ncbi:MAG: hypothetical protein LBP35_02575 [Candidatus Ancillula trichonymphae]|jgi:hypothetical protein|nr:hypothetical protein [Candidatus Ancillula trichonymphae]